MTRPTVRRIAAGGIIRASWLNTIVDNLNDLTIAYARPRQRNQGALPVLDENGNAILPTPAAGQVWTENNRTVSIVRVENPDDPNQWVDFERMETVCFSTPQGDVQLVFNNVDP